MSLIYVVEDDKNIREIEVIALKNSGFEVEEFETAGDFNKALDQKEPDLLLLDIMLPDADGLTIVKNIRQSKRGRQLPIILVTAKTTEIDKVRGLDIGADDYLTKPFNPLEAVARINSNIRRFYSLGGGGGNASVESAGVNLKVKDLELDTDSCVLYQGQEKIELSSVEYRIMRLFMEHPGKVFTKGQIFSAGWNEEFMEDDNNVMVCISKLRGKLSDDGSRYIRTVRGLGYRMEK